MLISGFDFAPTYTIYMHIIIRVARDQMNLLFDIQSVQETK